MAALATITLLASASASTVPSWDEAHARAKPIVKEMTFKEKTGLMLGIGWKSYTLQKWWYVGNTPAVPRLGIPTLNMQDAAGGFRTYWTPLVGTVTCWPSLLSMAATFDVDIVNKFGVALGEEFAGKGANTILGPSINVHRVARNGRNFEYLSVRELHASRCRSAAALRALPLTMSLALAIARAIRARIRTWAPASRSNTCTACSRRA